MEIFSGETFARPTRKPKGMCEKLLHDMAGIGLIQNEIYHGVTHLIVSFPTRKTLREHPPARYASIKRLGIRSGLAKLPLRGLPDQQDSMDGREREDILRTIHEVN